MNAKHIANRIVKVAGRDALLQATQYTLDNLEYAAKHELIIAERRFQTQLGESVKMLRDAIAGLNQPTGRDALLQAAQYTLNNLDYAAEHGLITAERGFQAQLGESARMLRDAIAGLNQPTS